MKSNMQEIIAGLDLGNNMIRVAIGKRCDGGIEIIGVGQSTSRVMRKGEVIDVEIASAAIRKAVNEAEQMAGCKVKTAVVGFAGASIRSQMSHGELRLKHGKVCERDIHEVIELARAIQLPPDHEILHFIPCGFVIDKQTKTSAPLGTTGSLLEVKAHIITVSSGNIQKIANACKLAGLRKMNIVLQLLATAETVLQPEELEQGVVLIDFGGGPVKVAVFSNGALKQYNSLWLSGNKLTEDVAVGLRIPMVQAEQIKRLQGCCLENMVDSEELIEIDLLKDNSKKLVPRQRLAEIIGWRTEEMFTLISVELQKTDRDEEPVGTAVISGGSSFLPGMKELASQVLNMPVRIGMPGSVNGLVDSISQPHHSTAVGLVLLGARKGFQQGIKADGDNLLILRTIQMIRRVWREFE